MGEKYKAIWGKKYDSFLKKEERCMDQKSKMLTIEMGQRNKPMKNRVESIEGCVEGEKESDVITLI